MTEVLHIINLSSYLDKYNMNIIHYAGISTNKASGVSVVVPQIINAQAELMNVCFYNYGKASFNVDEKVIAFNCEHNDDYHTFPVPFNKPDIVVFHSPFGIRKSIHLAKNLKKEGIPYIVVPHGCFSLQALRKKPLKKFLAINIFFKKMFSRAAAVQFLSEEEKKSSKYKEKGIVIANGVLIPNNYKRNPIGNGIKISFVGRKDIYHKGLDLLIKACAKICSCLRENDVNIYLYGPYENNQDEIKTLIFEHKVEDIVFDLPAVFGKDKETVYLNTDLIVLTSRFEGLPCAILEALSYGLPVLITEGTTLGAKVREYNAGWVAETSIESIAETLKKVIAEKTCFKEKSRQAIELIKENFAWDKIAKDTVGKYKEIRSYE